MKLAIVTTHPIQYNAPLFKLLAQKEGLEIKVFYTWSQSKEGAKFDPGFQRVIQWDIPLLDGYDYSFVDNIAAEPGSHHFKGIDNPTLNAEIEKWGADKILIFGWSFKSHLSCLRYFKGKIPILFRGDSTLLDETPGMKKILRRLFLRWVYSHVDKALYVGTNNLEYYKAHGLKQQQLELAPHAVDNKRFQDGEDVFSVEAEKMRCRLGLKNEDFVLLFAGKLESKKNPFLLLEIAKNIKTPNLKIVIAGNGPLETELKLKAENDSRIVFSDFVNQQAMPALYRICDVFILPSQGPGETWGLAVNEAMACGKPVVVTDKVGGAIDLVQHKENGFILNNENFYELIAYLEMLLNNKEELQKAGLLSKAIINSFTFDVVVENITSAINAKN